MNNTHGGRPSDKADNRLRQIAIGVSVVCWIGLGVGVYFVLGIVELPALGWLGSEMAESDRKLWSAAFTVGGGVVWLITAWCKDEWPFNKPK